jgi:AcrR family transcriptional regulator
MNSAVIDKREKILKAALNLFTERGFHNTPTSLIAKEAGVATGTLFHHFKNKEELINRLYLDLKKQKMNALIEAVDETASLQEKLKSMWINGVQWGIMHPKEFQFVMQYSNSPFISHLTKEQAMGEYQSTFCLFEQAISDGLIKPAYPEFVADYFEGIFNLAVSHFRKYPEKISEENLDLAFDMCWNGIARVLES